MENDLKNIIGCGALILDVRTAEEYEDGHIEGSLNIPLDEIGKAMEWLQKMCLRFWFALRGVGVGRL